MYQNIRYTPQYENTPQYSDILLKHQNTPQYSQVRAWNKKIKFLHSASRYAFLTWVHNGRPRHGVYFEKMKVTRKKFKLSLKHCKKLKEQHKSDALAASLHSSSSRTAFW